MRSKVAKRILEETPEEVRIFVRQYTAKVAKKKKIIPQFGRAMGKIKMSADFDAPLDDFKEYME